MTGSALYVGTVRHRRFRPVEHAFTYPLFMAYLDVDRIDEAMAASPFTSRNRWNWASFHDRDHFGDPALPVRGRLAADARAHGVELPAGPIYLLTHLRVFGYVFNPVSLWYCHEPDGRLTWLLAEVSNTFGETHNYWFRLADQRAAGEKQFHVSPFIEADCRYEWNVGRPDRALAVHMDVHHGGGLLLDCTLAMERRPWTAGELARALVRFPWMTAKVIAAIHWQAVRLWMKGVPVVRHPGPGRFAPAPTRHFGASWSVE